MQKESLKNYKKLFKLFSIFIKNILFIKKTNELDKEKFHKCIHKCWKTVFIISFIIILIDSITRGIHKEIVKSLENIHGDLRITLIKNINEKNVEKFKNKIKYICAENFIEIENIFSIGIHNAFSISSNESIYPIIILTGNDFINKFKNKPNGNNVLYGKLFLENNNLKNEKYGNIIFSKKINFKNCTIKFEKIKIKFKSEFDFGLDDLNNQTIIIDSNIFKFIIEKNPINNICIKLKDNNYKNKNLLKEKISKLNIGNVNLIEDSYNSISEIISMEKKCSNLICILLLILSNISILNLLYIFLIGKKKEFCTYLSFGFSKKFIFIICFVIAVITTIIFSIFGISFGWFISLFLNKYKIIKINVLNSEKFISFYPSIKTFLYIISSQFIICLYSVLKIIKDLKKEKIHEIIQSE